MEWISIKDRLPNNLQKVLFHWVSSGRLRNIAMGYLCEDGWDIYLPYHSYKLRQDKFPVTHWRDLPEFPEMEFKTMDIEEFTIDDPLAQLHKERYKYVDEE